MTCLRATFDSLIHLTRRIRAVARLLTIVSATTAVAVSGSTVVHAATATANLTVQINVTASCTINAATLDFGSTSLLATLIDATTTLSVTCTNTTPYSIGMDNGVNFSATRRMQQGASGNFIGYAIYTDAARTNPWTTASSSTTCTAANSCFLGTGNGSAQSITVYGRVPALGSGPAPGVYTDTVTMTVTY